MKRVYSLCVLSSLVVIPWAWAADTDCVRREPVGQPALAQSSTEKESLPGAAGPQSPLVTEAPAVQIAEDADEDADEELGAAASGAAAAARVLPSADETGAEDEVLIRALFAALQDSATGAQVTPLANPEEAAEGATAPERFSLATTDRRVILDLARTLRGIAEALENLSQALSKLAVEELSEAPPRVRTMIFE